MSEVGFFDEAAALKWQIMRMEGVMAASLNNTGSAILELAARLQELAERQEAAAAAGVSASGLATVVGNHHCPDVGASERTAAGIAELVVLEVARLLPATKAAATASPWWDPSYWFPLWMSAWCPPIALGLLAWGAYRGKGVGEKLSFIMAGGFFSPHLGLFALAVWLWWAVPVGIRKAKDYIWQRIVALFRCPPCRDGVDVEQGQPEEAAPPPPAAGGSVRRRRRPSVLPEDAAVIDLGGENDHQEEESQSFYGYLRSMVLPSNYLPLGARLGFELW
jgi:hypothetical protein